MTNSVSAAVEDCLIALLGGMAFTVLYHAGRALYAACQEISRLRFEYECMASEVKAQGRQLERLQALADPHHVVIEPEPPFAEPYLGPYAGPTVFAERLD